jgi:soluble lytic murein transglycosylase
LSGWPREARREEAAETLMPMSSLPPQAVVAWFGGQTPRTGQGALALARALNATGQSAAAAALIRTAWRTQPFDQVTQDAMIAAFGATLTLDDYEAREDMLLYGAHDAVALDLLRYLPADQQALAQARMALRRGDSSAQAMIAALPMTLQNAPGLIYERVIKLRDAGMDVSARQLMIGLPEALPDPAAAERLWKHGSLVLDALRDGDAAGAYAVAAHSGLTSGPNAAEAQFLAGWIALTRLKNPTLADTHFAKVADAGGSPLTQSRAYYWRGRAAEAAGDPVNAQLFYGQAARFNTAFYGQLAAQRTGVTTLSLGRDPEISTADRAAFEALGPIKALRYLAGIGAKDEFRIFAADLADLLPTAADEAMLTDIARAYGDQQIGMRVVRNAARRGFILPERGYPVVSAPDVPGGAEAALVLGVTRQESSFDPMAHSGAGARGMMQLMPGTAEILARRLGLGYSSYELEDPQYNMRLGSAYLGQLVAQFSGSYVMAAAAYNAGPGRPVQWTAACGDPRGSGTDPLNFIECIPFSETRDYVMRVMEATQVYRARLRGGTAPLTLESDLRRGGYVYGGAGAGS